MRANPFRLADLLFQNPETFPAFSFQLHSHWWELPVRLLRGVWAPMFRRQLHRRRRFLLPQRIHHQQVLPAVCLERDPSAARRGRARDDRLWCDVRADVDNSDEPDGAGGPGRHHEPRVR